MKKLISVLLAVIIAFSCAALFSAVSFADDAVCVKVSTEDTENGELESAEWWKAGNGEYYFFIPSYWDASSVLVTFTGAQSGKLNGEEIASGTVCDLSRDGKFTFGGTDYVYHTLSSSGIGTVFINTESGSLDNVHADKNNKEAGKVAIYNAKGKNQCSNDTLDYIKGRGNQTWKYEKRPYNIKLNKKVSVLGMAKSKKWSLIANYDDSTLARNAIVYGAAAGIGLEYSPEYQPVDLFINNEYKGSYLITTKVDADSNSVDIENLDDKNEDVCVEKFGKDFEMDSLERMGTYGTYAGLLEGTYKYVNVPETEDSEKGGYILEMELANRYADEISGFVTTNSQPVTMKSPEYASKAQIEFIRDYYQRFEDAVYSSDNKNADGEYYYDLADITSFAKYYIISEWASNMDSGLTSTYFYLDSSQDGILYAGPVWDYDIALGNNGDNRYGCDYTNPEEFTVAFGRMYRNTVFGSKDVEEKPTLFNKLTDKEEFIAECKKNWDESVYNCLSAVASEGAPEYIAIVRDSAIMDHTRWNTYGTYSKDEIAAEYDKDTSSLINFITKRTEFLNKNIGDVQENPHKTNFVSSLVKKLLTGINNLFEKFIVLFGLENKQFKTL